jgi:hypothetical protein
VLSERCVGEGELLAVLESAAAIRYTAAKQPTQTRARHRGTPDLTQPPGTHTTQALTSGLDG